MLPEQYAANELEPRHLSEEEIADPYLVVHELFSYGHLPELRQLFWEFLKANTSGTWQKLEQEERVDLLYFYERLQKLVEAAHIMHRQRSG